MKTFFAVILFWTAVLFSIGAVVAFQKYYHYQDLLIPGTVGAMCLLGTFLLLRPKY